MTNCSYTERSEGTLSANLNVAQVLHKPRVACALPGVEGRMKGTVMDELRRSLAIPVVRLGFVSMKLNHQTLRAKVSAGELRSTRLKVYESVINHICRVSFSHS